MKKYFSKDWKFFWRQDSFIGNWYGVIMNRMGLMILNLGRKLLRKGGGKFRGTYYQNCSWCGSKNWLSVSRNGCRCMSLTSCDNKGFV